PCSRPVSALYGRVPSNYHVAPDLKSHAHAQGTEAIVARLAFEFAGALQQRQAQFKVFQREHSAYLELPHQRLLADRVAALPQVAIQKRTVRNGPAFHPGENVPAKLARVGRAPAGLSRQRIDGLDAEVIGNVVTGARDGSSAAKGLHVAEACPRVSQE